MKKNLIGAALDQLSAPAAGTPKAQETTSAPGAISKEDIEILRTSYGAKWATAARRGNPYGREVPKGEGDYIRATFVVEAKQHKAVSLYAKAEGLQIKEALELIIEVGLTAITGKGSADIELSPEDTAPKYTKAKPKSNRK